MLKPSASPGNEGWAATTERELGTGRPGKLEAVPVRSPRGEQRSCGWKGPLGTAGHWKLFWVGWGGVASVPALPEEPGRWKRWHCQDSQRRCCTEGETSRPLLLKGSIRGTQLFCPGKPKSRAGLGQWAPSSPRATRTNSGPGALLEPLPWNSGTSNGIRGPRPRLRYFIRLLFFLMWC